VSIPGKILSSSQKLQLDNVLSINR